MLGETVEGCRQIIPLQIQRGEVMGQVAGMSHGLLDEVVDPGRVRGLASAPLGQLEFQPFGHQRQPGELLPEVIVQVQADPPPLLLGDLQQLIFKTPAFGNSGLKPGIGRPEVSRALLHPRFQLVISAAQRLLRAAALAPNLGLAQLAFHRLAEARQVVFHDVVMRACLHRRHGRLLGDVAGYDDERQIQPSPFDEGQGLQGIEPRQVVVGDDQIPFLPFERGTQSLGRFDPVAGGRIPGALQFDLQQRRVVFRILDDQYSQWAAHSSESLASDIVT